MCEAVHWRIGVARAYAVITLLAISRPTADWEKYWEKD